MRAVFATRERRDEVIENYGAIEGGKQTLGRLAALVAAVAAVAAGSQPGSSSGRW